MRFIFIINNKKVFDNNYEIVVFGNLYVSQVDFSKFDEKLKQLNKKFKQQFKSTNKINKSYSSDSDFFDEDEEIENDYPVKKYFNSNFNINTNENIFLAISTSASGKSNKLVKIKTKKDGLKSILKKESNNKNVNNSKTLYNLEKRVSFGVVKFSY